MAQALHSKEIEPDRTVETVVHITEESGERQRGDPVAALEDNDGIISAEFCPLHYLLMLVRYDRDIFLTRRARARYITECKCQTDWPGLVDDIITTPHIAAIGLPFSFCEPQLLAG
jgi:hypothetical protein